MTALLSSCSLIVRCTDACANGVVICAGGAGAGAAAPAPAIVPCVCSSITALQSPPSTADFTPIVRAIQATNPDIVYVASYPPDSAGMVRAVSEVGLKTKMLGGGMVGLQFASLLEKLGPQLNGIVNYDFWVPEPTLQF